MKRVPGAVLLKAMPGKRGKSSVSGQTASPAEKTNAGTEKSGKKTKKAEAEKKRKTEKAAPMGHARDLRSGTVPYLIEADGTIRVMLVTPKGGGAWMLPKGNVEKGMTAHASAAKEAFEEAGVMGICDPVVLGEYRFRQSQLVRIFPLRITRILERWEETGLRSRFLFKLEKALKIADGDDIRSILRKLGDYVKKQS